MTEIFKFKEQQVRVIGNAENRALGRKRYL